MSLFVSNMNDLTPGSAAREGDGVSMDEYCGFAFVAAGRASLRARGEPAPLTSGEAEAAMSSADAKSSALASISIVPATIDHGPCRALLSDSLGGPLSIERYITVVKNLK